MNWEGMDPMSRAEEKRRKGRQMTKREKNIKRWKGGGGLQNEAPISISKKTRPNTNGGREGILRKAEKMDSFLSSTNTPPR